MQFKAQLPVAVGKLWQPLPYEYVRETLEELCSLSGQLEWNLADLGANRPTFKVLGTQEKHAIDFKNSKTVVFENPEWWEVLEIETFLDIGASQIERIVSSHRELSAEDSLSLLMRSLSDLFEGYLYDLALVSNLARPGSIGLFDGYVSIEEHTIRRTEPFTSWHFYEAAHVAKKSGWPMLTDLPIFEVWKWAESINGLSRGFSSSAIGRSLNALTHLTSLESRQPFILFWVLMGLEALYVQERGGVMEQLREKVNTLLGAPKMHKKKFARMYDLRSRLIHGQLDFSSAYSMVEGPKDDRFHQELGEATEFATALLLATIQQLVKRGWRELRFPYSVDGSA